MSRATRIVIVNWNGAEFLPPCLDSVLSQRGVAVRPVVIDNGSSDDSLDVLAQRFADVPVIRHPNNYAAANNRGVREADTDRVMLLNTDATLAPDALATLHDALDAHPDAAGAAPRILGDDGRVQTLGIEPIEGQRFAWRDAGAGQPDEGPGPARQVYGLSGCAVLFDKAAWDRVGGQDERFHMYYEDVDLSLRLRAAGRTLWLVPQARCTHVGHGSISKTRSGKDVLGERNRLFVIAKHFREDLAAELARSPWFAQVEAEQHPELLDGLCEILGEGDADAGRAPLLAAFAQGTASLIARDVVAPGGRTLLDERDAWIAAMIRELGRLRLYRLPGKRLKPVERAFLEEFRRRHPEP